MADMTEDTEAPPKPLALLARTGTRVTLLDNVAVPRDTAPTSPIGGVIGKQYRMG